MLSNPRRPPPPGPPGPPPPPYPLRLTAAARLPGRPRLTLPLRPWPLPSSGCIPPLPCLMTPALTTLHTPHSTLAPHSTGSGGFATVESCWLTAASGTAAAAGQQQQQQQQLQRRKVAVKRFRPEILQVKMVWTYSMNSIALRSSRAQYRVPVGVPAGRH